MEAYIYNIYVCMYVYAQFTIFVRSYDKMNRKLYKILLDNIDILYIIVIPIPMRYRLHFVSFCMHAVTCMAYLSITLCIANV